MNGEGILDQKEKGKPLNQREGAFEGKKRKKIIQLRKNKQEVCYRMIGTRQRLRERASLEGETFSMDKQKGETCDSRKTWAAEKKEDCAKHEHLT